MVVKVVDVALVAEGKGCCCGCVDDGGGSARRDGKGRRRGGGGCEGCEDGSSNGGCDAKISGVARKGEIYQLGGNPVGGVNGEPHNAGLHHQKGGREGRVPVVCEAAVGEGGFGRRGA